MRDGQMEMGMDEGYAEMMAQLAEIYGDRYSTGMESTEEEKEPGFVISVVGYSPYENLMALLDPPNVEKKPEQWGLVTRLNYIDAFVDANSPFELYSQDANHFAIEKGFVDLAEDIPIGIGAAETIPDEADGGRGATSVAMGGYNQGIEILVDPVTRERIDAEPVLDARGKPKVNALNKPVLTVRDSWFTLDFKLKWEHAPEIPKAASSTPAGR